MLEIIPCFNVLIFIFVLSLFRLFPYFSFDMYDVYVVIFLLLFRESELLNQIVQFKAVIVQLHASQSQLKNTLRYVRCGAIARMVASSAHYSILYSLSLEFLFNSSFILSFHPTSSSLLLLLHALLLPISFPFIFPPFFHSFFLFSSYFSFSCFYIDHIYTYSSQSLSYFYHSPSNLFLFSFFPTAFSLIYSFLFIFSQ